MYTNRPRLPNGQNHKYIFTTILETVILNITIKHTSTYIKGNNKEQFCI